MTCSPAPHGALALLRPHDLGLYCLHLSQHSDLQSCRRISHLSLLIVSQGFSSPKFRTLPYVSCKAIPKALEPHDQLYPTILLIYTHFLHLLLFFFCSSDKNTRQKQLKGESAWFGLWFGGSNLNMRIWTICQTLTPKLGGRAWWTPVLSSFPHFYPAWNPSLWNSVTTSRVGLSTSVNLGNPSQTHSETYYHGHYKSH